MIDGVRKNPFYSLFALAPMEGVWVMGVKEDLGEGSYWNKK